ncbi:MAG TPA: bifunctional diaminohydroxyphosphoribosylaminopyrimidine deaminase/5-amino-6-(5-phosphoribosylamino)uracil reductase RibD [Terriglobales bacterium]|nr:bifunctional diaminohydroxyphosphoribosylaminopyrimidine deaminase/5-amino-6-(5-phosphoribosylamino)uracil reductase RibD [Terriglobales bacterium]
MTKATDEQFMQQALQLAEQSVGLASPNPNVGALLVSDSGEVVGSGHYTYDGLKHAEVIALEKAGERARGSTLYINFEPCCHQGRTGPCTDALTAAGIRQVVASIADPNPQVRGKGFARLRAAGIRVLVGAGEAQASKLNEAFAKYIRHKTPLVTLKAGMTLDGKIAPPSDESAASAILGGGGVSGGWITSDAARAHVQELRHQHDAILVGVGTIIADDPLLTDRSGKPRRRALLRVIVDSRLRLPLESRVVKTAKDDLLVLCSFAEEKKRRQLEERGVQVEQVPLGSSDGRPGMREIAVRLGKSEITSLLIEGGAMVNWTALASGVVDKVFLYYAPKILAGTGSVPFAAGQGFRRMSEAAHLRSFALHRFGEDFAVEGYLRDPYGD